MLKQPTIKYEAKLSPPYPIELAACADLRDREKEREFFDDCKRHFDNIRQTGKRYFPGSGLTLHKADAVLEPV